MDCPRCDSAIRWDVSYCPECGLPIEKLRGLLRGWECPRCERSLSEGETECQGCGLAIGALRERVLERSEDERTPPAGHSGPTGQNQTAHQQSPPAANGPQSGPPPENGPQSGPGSGAGSQADMQPQHTADETRPDATNGGVQPTATNAEAQPNATNGGNQPASANGGTHAQHRHGEAPPQQHEPRAPANTGESLFSGLPLVSGGVVGLLAYAVNFVAVFLLVLVELTGEGLGNGSVSEVEFGGWILYNAHTVDISLAGASGVAQSQNYLDSMYAGGTETVPKVLYYFVPLLVLFLGSVWLVRRYKARRGGVTAVKGAVAGSTIAVGYATATVLGAATVFSVSQRTVGGVQTAHPSLVTALVVMGLGFPLVVGALGGVVGSR